MEIEALIDSDRLEMWLGQGDSSFASATIATRAALRVQPSLWRLLLPTEPEKEMMSLAFFWSLSTSSVAAKSTSAEFKATVKASHNFVSLPTIPAPHPAVASNPAIATRAVSGVVSASDTASAAAHAAAATFAAAKEAAVPSAMAALSDAVFWEEVRRDALALVEGASAWDRPLWKTPPRQISDDWNKTSAVWRESSAPWPVFARIYEDLWNGLPPDWDWDYLNQIVLIDPKMWNAGPDAVAEAIAEIDAVQKSATHDASKAFMRVALGDFRFDVASDLLHIIPFEEDTQHLKGEALEHFLNDAETARKNLKALAERCAVATATGLQHQLAVSINLLLKEFSEARQLDTLNARIVIMLCADLQDYTADNYTQDSLGPVRRALDRRIAELNTLIWKHFAPSLLRLKPLESLELLPDENAAEVVEKLRKLLAKFETVPDASGARPDAEAMVVLQSMLRRLEELERRLRVTLSGDDKTAVKQQFAAQTGLLAATLGRGSWRSAEARQKLRGNIDEFLKDANRSRGLMKLVQIVWDAVGGLFGGGAPPPGA